MRSAFLVCAWLHGLLASAQIQNWNPEPYHTDSALIFRDDLDYYLNSYSQEEIKAMRKQVNIWRMNFDKVIKSTIADLRTYSEGGNFKPGFHDFELRSALDSSRRYDLGEAKGRVRAFMFGSITNPPARFQLPYWDRLQEKYAGKDVDLFLVYGKELHPEDKPKFKDYPAPKSEYEKRRYARDLAAMTKLPVFVDGLNDAVLNAYGRVPNGVYVFDVDDNLVFRGTWADSRKIEHIIDTLLKWYADGRPKAKPKVMSE